MKFSHLELISRQLMSERRETHEVTSLITSLLLGNSFHVTVWEAGVGCEHSSPTELKGTAIGGSQNSNVLGDEASERKKPCREGPHVVSMWVTTCPRLWAVLSPCGARLLRFTRWPEIGTKVLELDGVDIYPTQGMNPRPMCREGSVDCICCDFTCSLTCAYICSLLFFPPNLPAHAGP